MSAAVYVDAVGDGEEASAAVLAPVTGAIVAAKRRGYCKPCFRWWKAHPQIGAGAAKLRDMMGAGFYSYDVLTDWKLYFAVSATGLHPWWSGLLLTFLLLPQCVCTAGMAYFLKTNNVWDDCMMSCSSIFDAIDKLREKWRICWPCVCLQYFLAFFLISTIVIPVSALAVILCDVIMVLSAPLPRRWQCTDTEFNEFIESYSTTRIIAEVIFESLPQIVLQLWMVFGSHGDTTEELDLDSKDALYRALAASLANAVFVIALNAWEMRKRRMGPRAYGVMLLQMGGGKAGNIAKRIANNDPTLGKQIDLRDSDVTDAQMHLLAEALKANTPHVTRINFSSNQMITDKGLAELAQGLKTNTHVVGLDFRLCDGLTDEAGKALLDLLCVNTTIRGIELFTYGSIESLNIPEELAAKYAHLQDFSLAPKETKMDLNLATKIQDLSRDPFRKDGVMFKRIADDDPTVPTHMGLWVWPGVGMSDPGLGFTDEIATKLAEALKTNTRIQQFMFPIGRNRITDVGGQALLDMLQVNTSIRSFNAAGCRSMSQEMQEKILELSKDPTRGLSTTTGEDD